MSCFNSLPEPLTDVNCSRWSKLRFPETRGALKVTFNPYNPQWARKQQASESIVRMQRVVNAARGETSNEQSTIVSQIQDLPFDEIMDPIYS